MEINNFFEGLYLTKKLNIKNFKIETRIIKSIIEEEIPIGNAQSHYIYLSFYSVIIMFMCDVKFPHV